MYFCYTVHGGLSIFWELSADVFTANNLVVQQFLVDFFYGFARSVEINDEIAVTVT